MPRPFRRSTAELIPLEDVRSRLRIVGQRPVGLRTIPVDRIVGSVGRALDFDRDFTPRAASSQARLRSLERAFPHGNLPPIEVFEAGGAYFVADGHHRVALTRRRGGEFLDALVVHLETDYEIPPDVDRRSLVLTEQHRRFLEESGLAAARPDARIGVADPAVYPELLESVKAHGWDLARRTGRVPALEDVAERWWTEVYEPTLAALREAGADPAAEYGTEADAFLRLHRLRLSRCASGCGCGLDDAARDASSERPSRRTRRALRRERGSAPLRRRQPGGPAAAPLAA